VRVSFRSSSGSIVNIRSALICEAAAAAVIERLCPSWSSRIRRERAYPENPAIANSDRLGSKNAARR